MTEEAWSAVFGEAWFWAAAILFWSGAVANVAGAPRDLVSEGERSRPEATLARNLARYRLSRGRLRLAGPYGALIGFGGLAYLTVEALFGGALALAALTVAGPVIGARLALDERARAAAAQDDVTEAVAALDQIWRAQFGAVVFAVAATLVAAALTAPN